MDDTVTRGAAQSRIVTPREIGVVAAFIGVLSAVAILASDHGILLTRALWVDEVHTVLVAGSASPVAVLRNLASGADFGPPLVPLAAWALRNSAGQLTPVLLRSASLVCVLGALLLTYAVLRRRFDPGAAVVAILAVGTQALVIAHSFEGRFYGPWLFCTAFFAWALTAPHKRVRLAGASVLLCTVHWYGVIAFALMIAASVAVHGRPWRAALTQAWPVVAGLVALALCLPLSLGQRNALSVSTWVSEFTIAQLAVLLASLWTTVVPVLAILAIAAGITIRSATLRAVTVAPIANAARDPGVAALLSLALMPMALAALSLAGQPSMVPRYNLPAVLVWAPLAALAADGVGKWPQRVMAAGLVWLWFSGYGQEAGRKRAFDIGIRQVAVALRQAKAIGVPVVFSNMHTLYAVSALTGVDRASLAFLEITDPTTSTLLSKAGLIERDVVRVHARRFGFPILIRQSDLRSTPKFAIVGLEPNLSGGYSGDVGMYGHLVFPDHCIIPQAPGVTLFVTGLAKC